MHLGGTASIQWIWLTYIFLELRTNTTLHHWALVLNLNLNERKKQCSQNDLPAVGNRTHTHTLTHPFQKFLVFVRDEKLWFDLHILHVMYPSVKRKKKMYLNIALFRIRRKQQTKQKNERKNLIKTVYPIWCILKIGCVFNSDQV